MAPSTQSSARPSGLIERAVTRLLMRPASVSAISDLSARFRLIDFEGEALKGVSWTPGDKLQIKLGGGFLTRTYTPIQWDAVTGMTRILAYRHGEGPGSEWVATTAPGDERPLFGPRASISLRNLPATTVLFGDETSIGIAVALTHEDASGATRHVVLEVDDRDEVASVLDNFGLRATLIRREADDGHIAQLNEAMLGLVEPDTAFVLSGKASSIQRVSRALKGADVATRQIRTKAYWAPGKAGLD